MKSPNQPGAMLGISRAAHLGDFVRFATSEAEVRSKQNQRRGADRDQARVLRALGLIVEHTDLSAALRHRKNANQTMPRISTARPVEADNNASTEGPGSA
jgi:hypothetical protein